MLMDLSFSPLFTAIDKQKTLLSADVGHFSLVRAMHLADLITLMNGGFPLSLVLLATFDWRDGLRRADDACDSRIGFCGVMSIFSSLQSCLEPAKRDDHLWWALTFLPFGLFFDFLDGRVARWRKKSSLMGQELDSLADLVRRFSATPTDIVSGVSSLSVEVEGDTNALISCRSLSVSLPLWSPSPLAFELLLINLVSPFLFCVD